MDYLKQKLETAQRIADLYLEKFPREKSYGVHLVSSEDASELTICHKLSDEEIKILRKCSRIAHRDECTLEEILDSEGYTDLIGELGAHCTPMLLDTIESIDLRHPLKFTNFSFQPLNEDGTLGYKENIGVPLTDKEFKEILVDLLINGNRYSINMLAYHKPKLGLRIIRHITFASFDFQFENWNPSVIDLSELKDICDQILNPFRDVLQLFKSNDKKLADFAHQHQIVADDDNEIYADHGTDSFHCLLHFYGTRLDFRQEGYDSETEKIHDVDTFSIEGKVLMDKFSLKSPEDIMPYLKKHFNTRDCLARIKKEFEAL